MLVSRPGALEFELDKTKAIRCALRPRAVLVSNQENQRSSCTKKKNNKMCSEASLSGCLLDQEN